MDAPYTKQEIERGLRQFTDNFTKERGTVTTGYKEEKEIIKSILRNKYKVVEVSDGRMSADEPMSWVILYSNPNGTSVKVREEIDWYADDDDDEDFDDELTAIYDQLVDGWYTSDRISASGQRKLAANPNAKLTPTDYTKRRVDKKQRIGANVEQGQIYIDDRYETGWKIENPTPEQLAYIEQVAREHGAHLSRGRNFVRIYL